MPAFKFNDPQEAYKAAALKLETLDRGLISLDLSFFGLRELPPSIGRMTSLRHLDLSSNQLGALPPEIGQLVGLETLNLRQNWLMRWPAPIELLVSTEIDLRGNEVVPPAVEAVFRLGLAREVLDELTVKNMQNAIYHFRESGIRLDDEADFLRSWIKRQRYHPPAVVWLYLNIGNPDIVSQPTSDRTRAIFSKLGSEAGSPGLRPPTIPAEPQRGAEPIAIPDGLVIHLRDVHQSLQQEPVLDGFDHPGLTILIDAFGNYPDAAARWMKDQLANPARASVAADILRLLCRFKPGTPVWRSEIVATALQSNADELRDAAIQAVESWAEPELVMLLEGHADAAPWLADYAAQVLEDLAEAP